MRLILEVAICDFKMRPASGDSEAALNQTLDTAWRII
jgi:hypothetical protein